VAHHKDALKRIKQDEKRRLRNQAVKTHYRNRIKKVKAALESGQAEAAQTALQAAIGAIDRAVSKGVIRKNTGSRYKSRLSRAVKDLARSKAA